MQITLDIDEQALAAAMRYAEGRTRSEVVNEALRRFARSKRQHTILTLRGATGWHGDIDELRKRVSADR